MFLVSDHEQSSAAELVPFCQFNFPWKLVPLSCWLKDSHSNVTHMWNLKNKIYETTIIEADLQLQRINWWGQSRGGWGTGWKSEGIKKYGASGQNGGVGKNPSLPCTTKRRTTTNLKSINKPKAPENQTAQNSDNQGIKEKINQNNQMNKVEDHAADSEKPPGGSGPGAQCWLKVKLRLRADCGLLWLLQWEKISVSHKSPLESALETSRQDAWSPLWPLPHRQHTSAARSGATAWWIPKAPPPYNLSGLPRQRNLAQMKEQSNPQKEN